MVPISSLLIPILLAAVLVFLASFLPHMVLPHHRTDFAKLPKEDEVRSALPPGGVFCWLWPA